MLQGVSFENCYISNPALENKTDLNSQLPILPQINFRDLEFQLGYPVLLKPIVVTFGAEAKLLLGLLY